MTPKMFLEDMLKNSLLFLIFGGSIFTLLILIIENSGKLVVIWIYSTFWR